MLITSPTWLPLLVAPFVGSFLGVLVTRLPVGEPVGLARSRCRSCAAALGPLDLVPLVSWALARGRCRHCGARVSLFYPAIELAALAVAAWAATEMSGGLLWVSCGLGWTLLALAWIDVRHLILPDALTLPLIPAGLLAALWLDADLENHAIGAALGFLVFWAIARLYRRIRHRDGLGLGDAKLLAGAGAWVSWAGLPGVVMIAACGGIAVVLALMLAGRASAASQQLAFGPFLCLGLWVVWLYGPPVLTW